MTEYEKYALILSAIAILFSIGIPITTYLYKKWLKAKLLFFPASTISLYFNKSGSYVRVGGTLESQNAPATIKNIEVDVVRLKDRAELKLEWSTFISPISQYVGTNPIRTQEIARAFKIYTDNLAPFFIEFSYKDRKKTEKLVNIFYEIETELSKFSTYPIGDKQNEFEEVKKEILGSDAFKNNQSELIRNLFWEEGAYELVLKILYNNDIFIKRYIFDISKNEFKQFEQNVETTILFDLYSNYNIPNKGFCVLYKDFIEKR